MSAELKQYAKDNPTVTPAEKWQRLITSLEKGLEKK
jgi:hypothetical protein